MSSNPIHITRTNYEEYFLLYIDNELSGEDRKAVEAFAMLHPDLGEELELLQGTTLEAFDLSFDNKESLLAETMKLSVVDESLLLYIDDELPAFKKAQVKAELANNTTYRAQHQALLQTKLSPADTVIYPYKKELLRKEEDSKRPFIWLRAAAAVILVAGIGGFFALNGDNATSDVPSIATIPVTKAPVGVSTQPAVTLATQQGTEPSANETSAAPVVVKNEVRKNTRLTTPRIERIKSAQVANDQIATIKQPSPQDRVTDEEIASRLQNRTNTIEGSTAQQNINTQAVTPAELPSYTHHTAATIEPSFASSMETKDDKGQGSVRGLLRKATRFIERRTGIKATDDDDRLLVGAVAISLK